jgi:hypothetical protein
MLRRARSWPLLALLVLAGCSRCGERSALTATSPARFIPREAQAALVVSDLGTLGSKLAGYQRLKLANFAAQLQGLPSAEAWVTSLMGQLGVDLRSRQALEAAGIDPARGAAAAFLGENEAFLVLATKDSKALESTFATFARTRLGATERSEQKTQAGDTLVVFVRPGMPVPMLGVLLTRDYALVGAGPVVSRLAGFTSLAEDKSLPKEPLLAAALAKLPAERDFYAWIPGTSPLLRRGALKESLPVQGLTLAGTLSESAVVLRAHAALPPERPALDALKTQPHSPELLGYLPEDSVLVARFHGEPAQLDSLLPALLGPRVDAAVREGGFSPKAELLERLEPGWVVGLSLSPTVQLGSMPSLDIRRTNPFRYAHLVAVAKAKDASTLPAMLETLPPVAKRFGANMEPGELAGQKVLFTSYSQGEGAHLAASGDKVVLAAPKPRLEAALQRLAGPPGAGPVAPELKGALQGPALAVVLDWRRLAEAVKALPSEAWGIGGFAIKASTVRWLEATDDLRALSLGLSAQDGALQAELTLSLGAR